mgnify:CR=1 FL=1
MGLSITILLFFLYYNIANTFSIFSQTSFTHNNYYYYENLINKYFNANNIDSLNYIVSLAILNGYDCYNFRIKRAILYYKQKYYEESINDLKTALSFNSNDPFALSYLYLTYLNLNDLANAKLIGKKLNKIYSDINHLSKYNYFNFNLNYSTNDLFDIKKINKSLNKNVQINAPEKILTYNCYVLLNLKKIDLNFGINRNILYYNNLFYLSSSKKIYEKKDKFLQHTLNLNFYYNKKNNVFGLLSIYDFTNITYRTYNAENNSVYFTDIDFYKDNYGIYAFYEKIAKNTFGFFVGYSNVNLKEKIAFEPYLLLNISKNKKFSLLNSINFNYELDNKIFKTTIELAIKFSNDNFSLMAFAGFGEIKDIIINGFFLYSMNYTIKSYVGTQLSLKIFKNSYFSFKYVFFSNIYEFSEDNKSFIKFVENLLNISLLCLF